MSTTTVGTIPDAPDRLTAAAINGTTDSIQLAWRDNSINESGFRIEQRATDADPWQVVTTTTASSYLVSGLNSSTSYTFRVFANNSVGDSAPTDVASATTLIAQTPFEGTTVSIPGRVQVEDFNEGSASIAYSDSTDGNAGGFYRLSTSVAIVPTADDSGAYDVSIGGGEWLDYTVNVATTGTYNVDVRAHTSDSGQTTDYTTITLGDAGSAGNSAVLDNGPGYQSTPITGLFLTAGPHVLRLSASGPGATINWVRLADSSTLAPSTGPDALTVIATTPGEIALTWADHASDENGYRIERRASGATQWITAGWAAADATAFIDRTTAALTSYEYRALAYNAAGDSAPSNIAAATSLDSAVRLVADLNQRDNGSSPNSTVVRNGVAYFIATQQSGGDQLWRSDGTGAGTWQLTTGGITPGFAASGNWVYFQSGGELWRTDGTTAGTSQFADLFPGPTSSSPSLLTDVNGRLYFLARDNTGIGFFFYTNGDATGVHKIDIPAVSGSIFHGGPADLTNVNGTLYFTLDDSTRNIWTTDGTTAGTYKLANLTGDVAAQAPIKLTAVGNKLFFVGQGDGFNTLFSATTAGVVRINRMNITKIVNVNGTAFLGVNEELWKSDGTVAGTQKITYAGVNTILDMAAMNGVAYFFAGTKNADFSITQQLWRTDGTAGGTYPLATVYPGITQNNLVTSGNRVFFNAAADQSLNDKELWATDGTAGGTGRVSDMFPGSVSSNPLGFVPTGDGRIFFSASGPVYDRELWVSDGTVAGTNIVVDINHVPTDGSAPESITSWNGNGYYFATETSGSNMQTLYRTDGATAQTTALYRFSKGLTQTPSSKLVAMGGFLYFYANDGTTGFELWKSDGTAAGTTRVVDLTPGATGSQIGSIAAVNNALYFVAKSGTQFGIWKSDGTAAGTSLVQAFSAISVLSDLTAIGSKLIFSGMGDQNTDNFWTLYTIDSASNAMTALANVPIDGNHFRGTEFTVAGSKLLFGGGNSPGGAATLWRTDGTVAGTFKLGGVTPSYLTAAADNKIFFTSSYSELWVTDGTSAATTTLVQAFGAQWDSSALYNLGAYKGQVYFRGQNDLWHSDGTAQGTARVDPSGRLVGTPSTRPVVAGDWLFLTGNNNAAGIWRTDGTAAGTVYVGNPHPFSPDITQMTALGPNVIFSYNNDGVYGTEPWIAYGPPPAPALTGQADSGSQVTLNLGPAALTGAGGKGGGVAAVSGSSGVAAYSVERKEGTNGAYVVVATIAGTQTTFVDRTLKAGQPYSYRVRAVNAGGYSSYSSAVSFAAAPGVAGRWLFYNNSAFDGRSDQPGVADDAAIATDKLALLPGTGPAFFKNYSSYSKGITGVMVDIAGLPAGKTPTAADFEVRTGTDASATLNPANWALATSPTVTLRRGAGVGGSDRVTLSWTDANAVKNAWLRIVVKPTANTGLTSADTFYFGNAVAETGDSDGTDAKVDSADYYSTRDHLAAVAPATSRWDFNHDGTVDVTDMLLARSSATSAATALKLISPPVSAAAPVGVTTDPVKTTPTPTSTSPTPTPTSTTPTPSAPRTPIVRRFGILSKSSASPPITGSLHVASAVLKPVRPLISSRVH